MADLGHFSLCVAGIMAIFSAIAGYTRPRDLPWANTVASLALGQLVFVALAFIALVTSFLQDDFSIAYVANHSNTLLPWYYKISAVWGGHEGSFVLWILFLTGWASLVALRRGNYPRSIVSRTLATMSVLNLGFISFSLLTSDPFARLIPLTPIEGSDLNPLLQDFGLIVHPPMLYAGYVGLAVPFSFAFAGMLENRVDATWARWVRPWANASWAFLTMGITLGSWWAYYELGWGGWWFWDPSENASFMPWLAATALIHSLAVTEKRSAFKSWTLLLAIAGFSLALLGGFIIRSGVLTSVHAFAVDPERGLYILMFLGFVVGGSLTLYAIRAGAYHGGITYKFASREFFMLANNAILMISLAAVMWGTLAPLGYEAITGGKISLGPPFFDRFFIPLMLVLGTALALVPVLNWKRTPEQRLRPPLVLFLPVSAVVGTLIWFILDVSSLWLAITLVIAFWILGTHVVDLWRRARSRAKLPLATVGMYTAHIGFAISLIGIGITSTLSVERDVRMVPGDVQDLAGLEVTFGGMREVRGPNYVSQQGQFVVRGEWSYAYTLLPEKRRYLAGGAIMTEAGIHAGFLADTYISLGEPLGEGAWAVRLHYKPLVRWVWLGALAMAFGGLIALMDARYRRLRQRAGAAEGTSHAQAPSA